MSIRISMAFAESAFYISYISGDYLLQNPHKSSHKHKHHVKGQKAWVVKNVSLTEIKQTKDNKIVKPNEKIQEVDVGIEGSKNNTENDNSRNCEMTNSLALLHNNQSTKLSKVINRNNEKNMVSNPVHALNTTTVSSNVFCPNKENKLGTSYFIGRYGKGYSTDSRTNSTKMTEVPPNETHHFSKSFFISNIFSFQNKSEKDVKNDRKNIRELTNLEDLEKDVQIYNKETTSSKPTGILKRDCNRPIELSNNTIKVPNTDTVNLRNTVFSENKSAITAISSNEMSKILPIKTTDISKSATNKITKDMSKTVLFETKDLENTVSCETTEVNTVSCETTEVNTNRPVTTQKNDNKMKTMKYSLEHYFHESFEKETERKHDIDQFVILESNSDEKEDSMGAKKQKEIVEAGARSSLYDNSFGYSLSELYLVRTLDREPGVSELWNNSVESPLQFTQKSRNLQKKGFSQWKEYTSKRKQIQERTINENQETEWVLVNLSNKEVTEFKNAIRHISSSSE